MRFLRRTEEAPHKTVRSQEENGSGKVGRLKRDPRWRLYLPEVLILLLSVTALVAVEPLRDVLAPIPVLLFLAAFTLFMIPGLVLSLSLVGDDFSGPARIPVAFVLSAGIFGFAALPELVLGRSIAFYPLIC